MYVEQIAHSVGFCSTGQVLLSSPLSRLGQLPKLNLVSVGADLLQASCPS